MAILWVTVDDRRAEAIPFSGSEIACGLPKRQAPTVLPVNVIERAENEGQTRLALDLGAAHMTLASLRLESDKPLFTRTGESGHTTNRREHNHRTRAGAHTVYRVAVEGFPPAERVEVPLELDVPGRELLVLVDNGAQPAAEDHDSARDAAAGVRGVPRATRRRLRAPDWEPRCGAPRYDASLGARLKGGDVDRLVPRRLPIIPLTAGRIVPETQNLGGDMDVADWSTRKRVKMARAGVQQVELDLDVLAKANPSLPGCPADRDGKQRPYIFERTCDPAETDSGCESCKRPEASNCQPLADRVAEGAVPVTRLTCTTPPPCSAADTVVQTPDRG